MPEEIAIIAVIAIMAGTVLSIVRMVLGYRERVRGVALPSEKQARLPQGSSSVTTSELERMMRDAVQDATRPLMDRVGRLERQIGPAREEARVKADESGSPE